MFEIATIDNRMTPRIKSEFPLKLGKQCARSINLNDDGLCFVTMQQLKSSRLSGDLKLPYGKVHIKFNIIWEREISKEWKYVYGAKYEDIDIEILNLIRKSLIFRKFKDVIREVKNKNERRQVKIFSKYVLQYFFDLFELMNKIAHNMIEETEAERLLHSLTEDIMEKANEFENSVSNKIVVRRIKKEFRELVSCWAYKSYIVKRSYDKPRGYPGDYRIMEHIYDTKVLSKGIGRCFDVYFQNNKYAVAVRSRKDWMRDYLKTFILNTPLKKVRILNIACGSGKEIRELFHDAHFLQKIKDNGKEIIINLLDQDSEAVLFTRGAVEKFSSYASFNYFKNDVLEFITNGANFSKIIGENDLVYTTGLMDYLPDRISGKLLNIWFDKYVAEAGRLIIAHKDTLKYKPLPPNWFCDWNFYFRARKNLDDLIKKSLQARKINVDVHRDKSGIILFFIIRKEII